MATMALAISYLPILYAAYGRWEPQLLTLDDLRASGSSPRR